VLCADIFIHRLPNFVAYYKQIINKFRLIEFSSTNLDIDIANKMIAQIVTDIHFLDLSILQKNSDFTIRLQRAYIPRQTLKSVLQDLPYKVCRRFSVDFIIDT